MSLYRPKKSPYWHYDFQVKGVRFHGSTGTADKAAAKLVEATERTKAAEGRTPAKRKMPTLNEAFDRYYQEHAQHTKTADDADYMLANLLDGLGADTLLSEVGNADLTTYIARRRAHVSNASVNREVEKLRAVMNRAVDLWDLDIGKQPNWKRLRLIEPAGRTRELTGNEAPALLDALADIQPGLVPVVEFCRLTGARLMSALRLTWNDIDYQAGTVTLRNVKSERDGQQHVVPLTPAAVAVLAPQRGDHPIYVFTYQCRRSRGQRRKGERYPFSKDGWRRDWAKALKAADIEDLRFHDLRHDAGTKTLRACGNLAVVQRLLGHADIASTARYAHVNDQDVAAAMQAAAESRTESRTGDALDQNRKENKAL